MNRLKILKPTGIVASIALGVSMALTNPSQSDYEEFAAAQLTDYLKKNVCTEVSQSLGEYLQRQCTILVDTGRPRLKRMIAEDTYQYNFIIFSIYNTDLSISPLLPTYHFKTLGIFHQCFIYEAEKQ